MSKPCKLTAIRREVARLKGEWHARRDAANADMDPKTPGWDKKWRAAMHEYDRAQGACEVLAFLEGFVGAEAR